jgi:hypothetical protein
MNYFNTYMVGVVFGLAAGLGLGLWTVGLFACRMRFHKWYPWELDNSGAGQIRRCQRCGYYDVRPFVHFSVTKTNKPESK